MVDVEIFYNILERVIKMFGSNGPCIIIKNIIRKLQLFTSMDLFVI